MHTAQMASLGAAKGKDDFKCEDATCALCGRHPDYPGYRASYTIDRVVGRTRQEVEARLDTLSQDDAIQREYLLVKYRNNDLHGVEDAASDLRDLEAAMGALRWVLGE